MQTAPPQPRAQVRADGAVDPATGPLALLGGDEHRPGSEVITRALLDRLGRPAPRVTVVPVASAPRQVGMVAALARNHWTALGTTVGIALPGGGERACDAVAGADVIVLPGGVPDRVVGALGASPLWDLALARWRAGAALVGSSAGAMGLFAWRLRLYPPRPLALVPGLGPLGGWVAAPHFDRFRARHWGAAAAPRLHGLGVLGLDEGTAVVGRGRHFTVAGHGAVTTITGGAVRVHHAGAQIVLEVGPAGPPRLPDGRPAPLALAA